MQHDATITGQTEPKLVVNLVHAVALGTIQIAHPYRTWEATP